MSDAYSKTTYNGYTAYYFSPNVSYSDVSSTPLQDFYVYVDNAQVAYSGLYWYYYDLNLSKYQDGNWHKLELKYGSTSLGICYFIIQDNWPTHKPLTLRSGQTSVTRWERSYDNGATWTVLDNSASSDYTEQNPLRGDAMYRVLSDGQYYDVVTIHYFDEVPTEIVCSPKTVSKTVDEAVTFSLDMVDDGYTYQWYHNGSAISGATGQTLTIDPVKMADAGSYYCIVKNEVSQTQSTTCELSTAKCAQYITFPELETKIYGEADFTLPATTDKGLTIQYSSSNQAVATVSGNTVHIVAPGETYITANQPGNADYLEAAYVSRKLTVNKISQAINFPEIPAKTYEDIPFTLPEKSDKGLTISYKIINTEVATVSGNTVTIVGAGSTEIVASQEGDATHYAATPVTRTLTVNRQAQTLNFPAFGPKTFGDAPIVLNATTDKGLTVTYEADGDAVSIENNVVTIKHPGSAKVTATQQGNRNYLAIEPIVREITIAKAPQTISWTELPNKTYGDAPFELPALTDKGLKIAYTSSNDAVATVEGNTVTITGAGTTEITASQEGDEYYNPAAAVTLTLNIAKAYQTIDFPELPVLTYGDAPYTLTATGQSSAAVRYESSDNKVAVVEDNILTITGAGKCYITAYVDGDDNYYAATPVQRELNVAKSGQEIFFPEISTKTYGDEPFALGASSSNGLPVTYTSSATSVISISGNTATVRGAGTAVITATQAGNANYESATEKITITVEKATLIVTADNQTRNYGDENPEFTVNYQGFVNGDSEGELNEVPVVTTTADINSNVGTYNIVITPFTDTNYALILRNGLLTIEKAPLKVIVDDSEKTYGEANPAFTLRYEGFKNGQSEIELLNRPSLTTTAKTMSPVGNYPITAEGAEARNYAIEYVEGTLTVKKAMLTATLQDASREYGSNDEYVITYSGFKGTEKKDVITSEPEVSTVADIFSDAGTYEMSLIGGEADNYDFTFQYPDNREAALLTVTKAPLKITADSKTMTYMEAMPRFTMSFDGFRNGDTADDLDQFPYISCEATTSSAPGNYPIILSGGYDNNYDYILVNGNLAVINSPVVYVSDIVFVNEEVEISYPSSELLLVNVLPSNASNKDLSWETSDWTVATVSDGVVTGLSKGEATITATATDGSGVSASCLVKVVSGTDGSLETIVSENRVYTVGQSVVVEKVSDDTLVRIFNTSGTLIYSGYDERIDDLVLGYYIVIVGNDRFKIRI